MSESKEKALEYLRNTIPLLSDEALEATADIVLQEAKKRRKKA